MAKFGTPPVLSSKEPQRYGPASFRSPVPRISTQSITPRDRVGGVSVASSIQSTPRDRGSVASFQSYSQRKPAEKEKRWSLRGWDIPNKQEKPEDGIVGWVKRRSNLEAKRGTKKHSPVLDNEHYFPVQSRCTATEDFEEFRQQSLHSRFLPDVKVNAASQKPSVTFKYSKGNNAENESSTTANTSSRHHTKEDQDSEKDVVQNIMRSYRAAKVADRELLPGELLGRRSKSVPDLHVRYNAEQRNRIKRLLKFSNKGLRKFYKFDEDEDEGYSSKTSSAETKALSESEGDDREDTLNKHRLSNSMIDLSELPSNSDNKGTGEEDVKKSETAKENTHIDGETAKVKFSYTHQPTILQIPNPDMKLVHDRCRVEKTATSEEVPFSYSRLKRAREINKFYKNDAASKMLHENTLYDINALRVPVENPKPMTLVLRKISIQDADQQVTTVMNTNTPPLNTSDGTLLSRSGSRAGSRAGSALSRSGSVMSSTSRIGSSKSRTGSAKSRISSAASRCSLTPQMEFKNRMQQKHIRGSHPKDSSQDNSTKTNKEPMWSQEYSLIERQATSYCIGDLLPAMDKSIYTNQFVKGKLGVKHQSRKYHGMAPLLTDSSKGLIEERRMTRDDGYLLLQKGMDALAGDMDKPPLGPPPFRPAPARQPPVRNVKVVVRHQDLPRSSPVHGNGRYSPLRFNSERGPRPMMQSPEKETQRKLKEAFTKFYQNRPKEIGKEFRRMQTMWNG